MIVFFFLHFLKMVISHEIFFLQVLKLTSADIRQSVRDPLLQVPPIFFSQVLKIVLLTGT